MNSDIKQLLIDTRTQFEEEFGDVIIQFNCDKDFSAWRILMLDKRNRDKRIERIIPTAQIEYANFNTIRFEFETMRRSLFG